jgi:hypothetical protein
LTDRSFADDSTVSDIPWASVFDAAANVRALGAIQSQGFRAASEVVDKFVNLVGGTAAEPPDEAGSPVVDGPENLAAGRTTSGPNPNVGMVIGGLEAMLSQLVGTVRNVLPAMSEGNAAFDLAESGATGTVSLDATDLGVVSAEIWLHNKGSADLGEVALRCSDLLAHDGSIITSGTVRFDPDPVSMMARSSRGVLVEIDVPSGTPPGRYRGTLLAEGHEEVWLPVVLTVQPVT